MGFAKSLPHKKVKKKGGGVFHGQLNVRNAGFYNFLEINNAYLNTKDTEKQCKQKPVSLSVMFPTSKLVAHL